MKVKLVMQVLLAAIAFANCAVITFDVAIYLQH